jgi:seryl-tRNA synthetase
MSVEALVVVSGFLGVLIKGLFDYLSALVSAKSRQDKLTDLSQKYLNIADVTAEQLEERINLIGKLDLENRTLSRQVDELGAKRKDRDEQIEALEAGVAALKEQLERDTLERQALRRIVEEKDKLIEEVKEYLSGLLKYFENRNITDFPIPPDDLLDTHNKIKLKHKRVKR